MSISSRYPSNSYIAGYNFARTKKIPPEIQFSRSGTATYVGPDGLIRTAAINEPRFDHDPLTGQCKGLLVENTRTNNIVVSEDFSSGNWNKTAVNVSSNIVLAPNNTNTADLIIPTTAASNHNILYFVLYNTAHYSVFCKPFGYNSVAIGDGSNTWQVKFNLSNGTSTVMFGEVTTNIIPYPNGWYRVSGSVRSGTNNQFRIFPLDTFSRNPYDAWSGDGFSGVYLWGAQVETGTHPTSYIPTSGSTVTRSADILTVPTPETFTSAQFSFVPNRSNLLTPIATLTASTASPSYSLELSTPNLSPTVRVIKGGVESTRCFVTRPATISSNPNPINVAINFNQSTGEIDLCSSSTDDNQSSIVKLPATAAIKSNSKIDTITISPTTLRSLYFWDENLTPQKLATLADETSALKIGVVNTSGFPDELYEKGNIINNGRPTLDLDFATTKTLNDKITGTNLVTYTRASTGTYVGADGLIKSAAVNEARFDHDPVTGESLGLLVEEARTNFILNSAAFTDSSFWQGNQGITISPNQALAPDGIFNGTLIQQDTSTSLHQLSKGTFGQALTSTTSNYTISVFVKRFNTNRITLCESYWYSLAGYTKAGMVWDFSTESIVTTFQWSNTSQSTIAGTSITKYPNGWYRISLTVTPGSDPNNQIILPALVIGDTGNTGGGNRSAFAGNGVDGVYIWGFQVEIGSFPTSYIPTPATWTGRASTATFYDASGVIQTASSGVARSNAFFPDSSGVMRSAGLLLEAVGTNLLTYSQEFDNAAWQKQALTVSSNTTTAPDGTNTADTITGTADNIWHGASAVTTQDTATVTFSVFAKMGTGRYLQLIGNNDFGSGYANFDLQAGTVTAQSANFTGAQIVKIGNGWYRCSVVIEPTGNAFADSRAYVIIQDSGTKARATSFAGNGESLHIWGAQLEAGSFPTSYIPTTTATVTRAADTSTSATVTRSADVASITGTNFSSWYRQDEGTVFCQGISNSRSNSSYWTFSNGGSDGATVLVYPDNNLTYQVVNGGVIQVNNQAFTSYPAVASVKTAAAIKLNNFAVVSNGGSITSDTSGTVPAVTSFVIGNYLGGGTSYDYSGTISRLTYWPTRLPDTTLQTITAPIQKWELVLDSSIPSDGICALITSGTVTYTVDWGDETPVETVTATGTFTKTHGYAFPKEYVVKITVTSGAFRPLYNASVYASHIKELRATPSGWTNTASSGFGTNFQTAWYGANKIRKIDLGLNTSGITNFIQAWRNCSSLTSFPLINTSAVTSFENAWLDCSGLTSFPLINTAAVTNFQQAWTNCTSLTSFPLIITSAGTNFQSAWQGCSSLTSFPLINTSAGTNFSNVWNGCSSLTSFPLLNTASVTNFPGTWTNCNKLTSFPLINTAAATTLFRTWQFCSELTSFPLINTSLCTNFQQSWQNLSKLTSFPLINTSNGTTFETTWMGCTGLTSFPLINTSSGINFTQSWRNCTSLTTFPALNFNAATGAPTNTGNTGFLDTWNGCTNLANFPANVFDTTLCTRYSGAFSGCALTATSIENIIVSINTANTSNGTLTLSGGTNATKTTWTTAANTAYDALIARGWTITFRP